MRYEGHWLADRRENDGKLVWPNGDEYRGKWVHGARKGPGVLILAATGQQFEQTWNEQEDVKYSQITPLRFVPGASQMVETDDVRQSK
jgi:hypothetical protein